MSYSKKILSGVSWHLLALSIALPAGYLNRILYARYLPKEHVGLFYALWDLFAMLSIFRTLGVDQAVVHYIPAYLVQNRRKEVSYLVTSGFVLVLAFSLVLLLLINIFSPYIVKYYLNSKGNFSGQELLVQKALLVFAWGYFFLIGLAGYLANIFQGFQKQFFVSLLRLFYTLVVLLFSLFFIFSLNLKNFWVPINAYSLSAFLAVIFYLYFLFRIFTVSFPEEVKISQKFNFTAYFKTEVTKLLRYGLFVMLTSVGNIILLYTDGICLTLFSGLKEVADYRNVASPLAMILTYLTNAIVPVLFPFISELHYQGNRELLRLTIKKILFWATLLLFPLACLLSFGAKFIITLLFPSEYLSATPALRILAFAAFFSALNSLGFSILNGLGRPNLTSRLIYFGAVLNLVLNLLLIPKLGMIGASFATLFSYLAILLFLFLCF